MFRAYLELTKPRITLMVLVTTAMGFFLGGHGIHDLVLFITALAGTGLASSGANALNQYLERDADAKMERTRGRPIPAGLVPAQRALAFGILLTLAGVFLLAWKVNLLTGFLVLLAAFLYDLVYTPMKKLSWINTAIGAIPGAMPPLAGWTAASGDIGAGAWILFWILYLWQHPHFFAIAWMYREDYARGGFKMLPVVEPDGRRTFRQIFWHSILLIPVSLLPTITGMSGQIYCYGALILGLGFFAVGILFAKTRSVLDARKLLKASVIYLPLLLILIVIDTGLAFPAKSGPLPVLGQISSFELMDSRGEKFSKDHLEQKVWIADFIFTTCAGPCPTMTQNLATIYRSYLLEKDVHFVSFSVNPQYDSPQILSEYARRFSADPTRWHFLTGPVETVQRLALSDFKIGHKENPIIHSTLFVLVDRNFKIRGYYDGTEPEKIKKLFQDTAKLLKEK